MRMTAPVCDRRVRALRIRSGSASAARRGAIMLGDALHTASLPEAEGGRCVYIRRLVLGRIPAEASPAALALLVERAAREAAQRAVPFGAAMDRSAPAVRFPDRAHALVALARRHARREPTAEWWWEQIAPHGWAAATRTERWRLLLSAGYASANPILTVAEVVHQAVQAGEGGELVSAVTPMLAALWLRLGGWEPVRSSALVGGSGAAVSDTLRKLLPEMECFAGTADPRWVWVGTMLVVCERPARVAIPDLPRQVAAALAVVNAAPAPAVARGAPTDPIHVKQTKPPPTEPLTARSFAAEESPEANEPPGEIESIADPTSGFGGLLFLIPILQRVGFARWIAAQPDLLESDFPLRLLYFIGGRTGMTREDPLAVALWERMSDAARAKTSSGEWLCRAWLAAVRGVCWRRGRMNWCDVVRRTGRIRATRTHLEIIFEYRQAEVALRRLALDVDPGWVPWLGWVVNYHYRDRHESGH